MSRRPWRLGIVGSGYLLTANGVISAALGFLFWVLAARRFTSGEVGFAAAISSGVAVVAGIGVLGLNSAFLRFVPLARTGWPRLVARGYLLAALATAVIATIAIVVAADTTNEFVRLNETRWVVLLIVTSIIWTLFSLQDTVLIAHRSPVIVLTENASVGVVRIVLILVWPSSSAFDILCVWILPSIIGVVVVTAYLVAIRPRERAPRMTPNGMLRYCSFATFGSASTGLTASFTPVLVTALLGSNANARFFLAWSIALALQVGATSMASPLTVSIAHGDRSSETTRRVMLHCMASLGVAALVALAVGPWLLRRVGSGFAPPTLLLGLLLLAALLNGAAVVLFAAPRGLGKVGPVVAIQWLSTVILLGGSAWGLRRYGVVAVGWASVASQASALVIAARVYRRVQSVPQPSTLVDATP